MITAEKNGHTHEFPEQVWERMGEGNVRQGWKRVDSVEEPAEVELLRQKKKEVTAEVVEPVVVEKKKSDEPEKKEETPVLNETPVVEEPVVTVEKEKPGKKTGKKGK